MNKKRTSVFLIVLLVMLCLLILASCDNNSAKISIFDYSSDNLGVMGKLVRWMHGWVKNYGWTVVVFTVFLKLLMLPLDFWQRYASRKSTLKMQQMQPIIEGIDKRYGANTQRANEEKQKLYKKQGFSMLSTCLPMIVSMVIFFVMFAGLRQYSTYSSIVNYQNLYHTYLETYSEEVTKDKDSGLYKAYYNGYADYNGYNVQSGGKDWQDMTEKERTLSQIAGLNAASQYARSVGDGAYAEAEKLALEAVVKYNDENKESWLWIQNVWQPDTWATVMQPYKTKTQFEGTAFGTSIDMSEFKDGESIYNIIRDAIRADGGYGKNGTWNGLMILPVLSIGLSFLSMFISQRMERKNRQGEVVEQNQQQKTTNMMMMIMMPLMMAYFGFIYTGAFAIYMVVNYSLSIITTVAMRRPIEKFVSKRISKEEAKNKSGKASYLR